MNRPLALLVLLVLLVPLIAGCADDASPAPSGPGADGGVDAGGAEPGPVAAELPAGAWTDGETVELIDCRGVVLSVPAERARVQARIPPGFGLPGDGPLTVLVHIDVCGSALLEDRAIGTAVTFMTASVTVLEERPSDSDRQEFLLEASTSWPATEAVLRAFEVPGESAAATLSESAGGVSAHVTGGSTSYRVELPLRMADPFSPPDSTLRYRGGPEGSFDAKRIRVTPEADRLPMPCVADLSSGALSDVFPVPTPCIGSLEISRARLILDLPRDLPNQEPGDKTQ